MRMGHTTEGNNDSNDKRTENNIQHKHTERYVCIIQNCILWEREKDIKLIKYLYLIIWINLEIYQLLLDLWSLIGNSNLFYRRQVAVQQDKLENMSQGLE